MKILAFILSIVFVGCSIGGMAGNGYFSVYFQRTYGYALSLADDSSLPVDKAKYLTEYREAVDPLKATPRYIWMTPDQELDKQKAILDGLIRRCQDVANQEPTSLAYQQGMQQISGQEIDHQIARITTIFRLSAYHQSAFWPWCGPAIWVFLLLAAVSFLLSCVDERS